MKFGNVSAFDVNTILASRRAGYIANSYVPDRAAKVMTGWMAAKIDAES